MQALKSFARWFDSSVAVDDNDESIDWIRVVPFIILHVSPIAVLWVGWSETALLFCLVTFTLRMFAITAFYHRYFSHRTYRTSRALQFLFAVFGATACQRGPLWWAAIHRKHHRFADSPADPHSAARGLFWSHMGWFLSRRHFATDYRYVKDLARFPELVWIDRFDVAATALFAFGVYVAGLILEIWVPDANTTALQVLVWGYFVSTLVLIHASLLINSLNHTIGTRRYPTRCSSRNNLWLALLTLGEGWHNNHHHYPNAARQGFFWWELDVTYYVLRCMAWCGLIWDLKEVPERFRQGGGAHRTTPR